MAARRHDWDGAEDHIETLLKLYGLQSLSMQPAHMATVYPDCMAMKA